MSSNKQNSFFIVNKSDSPVPVTEILSESEREFRQQLLNKLDQICKQLEQLETIKSDVGAMKQKIERNQ
jgi:hypothetical protein